MGNSLLFLDVHEVEVNAIQSHCGLCGLRKRHESKRQEEGIEPSRANEIRKITDINKLCKQKGGGFGCSAEVQQYGKRSRRCSDVSTEKGY